MEKELIALIVAVILALPILLMGVWVLHRLEYGKWSGFWSGDDLPDSQWSKDFRREMEIRHLPKKVKR